MNLPKILLTIVCLTSTSSWAGLRPEAKAVFEKAQAAIETMAIRSPKCGLQVGALQICGKSAILPLKIRGQSFDIDASDLMYAAEQQEGAVTFLKFGKDPGWRHRDAFYVTIALDRNGVPFDLSAFKTLDANDTESYIEESCALER